MFTVLHRGPDGSEKYYEAHAVTRFPEEGSLSCPPLGVIRLIGVNLPDIPGETIDLAVEEPLGAVFVMNRFGTTVAKYTLAGKVSSQLEQADL